MLTLALETSTPHGSLALFDGETLLGSQTFEALRGHNSKIYEPLEAMLEKLEGRRLQRLVVGTGPGSYTGVRVAIAIADALALSHEAVMIGCSSMLAAALGVSHEHYWIVGDARRETWYRGEVRDGGLVGLILTEGREVWEKCVRGALAEGIPVATFDSESPLEGVDLCRPTAERLGKVSLALAPSQGPVEPAYLAAPFITQPKKPGKAL